MLFTIYHFVCEIRRVTLKQWSILKSSKFDTIAELVIVSDVITVNGDYFSHTEQLKVKDWYGVYCYK